MRHTTTSVRTTIGYALAAMLFLASACTSSHATPQVPADQPIVRGAIAGAIIGLWDQCHADFSTCDGHDKPAPEAMVPFCNSLLPAGQSELPVSTEQDLQPVLAASSNDHVSGPVTGVSGFDVSCGGEERTVDPMPSWSVLISLPSRAIALRSSTNTCDTAHGCVDTPAGQISLTKTGSITFWNLSSSAVAVTVITSELDGEPLLENTVAELGQPSVADALGSIAGTTSAPALSDSTDTPIASPTPTPGAISGPLAAAFADASPANAIPYAGATGNSYFVSPSGNIGCYIYNQDTNYVQCTIAQYSFPAPGVHCPNGAQLTIDAQGHPAYTGCADYPLTSQPERTLPYGSSLTNGTFSCVSLSTGVTCADSATSTGFTVSRQVFTPVG